MIENPHDPLYEAKTRLYNALLVFGLFYQPGDPVDPVYDALRAANAAGILHVDIMGIMTEAWPDWRSATPRQQSTAPQSPQDMDERGR